MRAPIYYLVLGPITVLVITALRRAAARPAPSVDGVSVDGVSVLRYSLAMRALFTLVSVAMCGVGAGGLLGVVGGAHESRAVVVVSSIVFVALGLYALLELNFVTITVDRDKLVHRTPWRRLRSIPWSEVSGHSRSDFNGWLVLETRQGKLRVSDFMPGASEIARRVAQRFEAK